MRGLDRPIIKKIKLSPPLHSTKQTKPILRLDFIDFKTRFKQSPKIKTLDMIEFY